MDLLLIVHPRRLRQPPLHHRWHAEFMIELHWFLYSVSHSGHKISPYTRTYRPQLRHATRFCPYVTAVLNEADDIWYYYLLDSSRENYHYRYDYARRRRRALLCCCGFAWKRISEPIIFRKMHWDETAALSASIRLVARLIFIESKMQNSIFEKQHFIGRVGLSPQN